MAQIYTDPNTSAKGKTKHPIPQNTHKKHRLDKINSNTKRRLLPLIWEHKEHRFRMFNKSTKNIDSYNFNLYFKFNVYTNFNRSTKNNRLHNFKLEHKQRR